MIDNDCVQNNHLAHSHSHTRLRSSGDDAGVSLVSTPQFFDLTETDMEVDGLDEFLEKARLVHHRSAVEELLREWGAAGIEEVLCDQDLVVRLITRLNLKLLEQRRLKSMVAVWPAFSGISSDVGTKCNALHSSECTDDTMVAPSAVSDAAARECNGTPVEHKEHTNSECLFDTGITTSGVSSSTSRKCNDMPAGVSSECLNDGIAGIATWATAISSLIFAIPNAVTDLAFDVADDSTGNNSIAGSDDHCGLHELEDAPAENFRRSRSDCTSRSNSYASREDDCGIYELEDASAEQICVPINNMEKLIAGGLHLRPNGISAGRQHFDPDADSPWCVSSNHVPSIGGTARVRTSSTTSTASCSTVLSSTGGQRRVRDQHRQSRLHGFCGVP